MNNSLASPQHVFMTTEESIERIMARVDFFQTSLEQLKRDLPKYVSHQVELKKAHSLLGKCIKSVASNEPHQTLQYFLFLFAQKQEQLSENSDRYKEFNDDMKSHLESWDKQMISPMRMVLKDHDATIKKVQKSGSKLNTAADVTNPLSPESNSNKGFETLTSLLPIHAKLFEQHRIKGLKSFFRRLILRELSYHTTAIQVYSELMECLQTVDDLDYQEYQQR